MTGQGGTASHTSTDAAASLFALMDTLAFVSRHMHPPRIGALAAQVRQPAAALRRVEAHLAEPSLQQAAALALCACNGLEEADAADNPVAEAYRAMRQYQRALAVLVAAEGLPPVSTFLLPPDLRQDSAVHARLAAPTAGQSGVFHEKNELTERGGFSVYVPPLRDQPEAWPLVMALHGGSGHGRMFLSNWVPPARARGFMVVAPTAVGATWSLMEPEIDTANLAAILDHVSSHWSVDADQVLLSGMSDGGTFTLLGGLDSDAPFTHLAPVAASFHPMLLSFTEPARLSGLPIYLTHGALDWMFPVSVGRSAHRALAAAGAFVTYREVPDLSHTYPVDEQPAILDWFLATPGKRGQK
ncbi:MAG: hypothetical protein ACJ8AI_28310 [Rhodopila sp.]